MSRLSVTIIAFNEADRLPATLEAVRFADEVIVVDAGSTDGTQELCHRAGVRLILRPFDGFVSQKQFALEQATHPWVLALDADEVVSPELEASIRSALVYPGPARGFFVNRCNFYLGRPIRVAGWYPDRKLRLVRREQARWTGQDPHDRLEVSGPTGALAGDLLHHSFRSLEDHARKLGRYGRVSATQALEAGCRFRVVDLIFRPPWYFFRRYLLAGGFREGIAGLILCGMGAFHVFLKYATRYELERDRGPAGAPQTPAQPDSESEPVEGSR